jgi:hypothetical protein
MQKANKAKFGCFVLYTFMLVTSEAKGRAMKLDGFPLLPWHFREHILVRESSFMESGGKLILPLPELEVAASL